MTELFLAVSTRLKAIFTAHAALELEAELITHHIERKAALFEQAAKLEEKGLKDLAAELRQHVGGLDLRRAVSSVLPMLAQSPTAPETTSQTEASSGNGESAGNGRRRSRSAE